MRYRLRQLIPLVRAALVTVIVAVAAGVAAVYLTGPNGSISCVSPVAPATTEPIPRWVLAAGLPAVATVLVGAYFALAAERVLARLIGLGLVIAVGAATFYAVFIYLPAACRP
ncbi:MAG TPA: hypothetical protein VFO73_02715 [Candidatus Limnocylindrales bacterium]|nr:hypothetical protein [Candidatus Limnocylindrales bacterium]